ncbi:hypothetical protein PR048_013907, partial [Dryococelus australis]
MKMPNTISASLQGVIRSLIHEEHPGATRMKTLARILCHKGSITTVTMTDMEVATHTCGVHFGGQSGCAYCQGCPFQMGRGFSYAFHNGRGYCRKTPIIIQLYGLPELILLNNGPPILFRRIQVVCNEEWYTSYLDSP